MTAVLGIAAGAAAMALAGGAVPGAQLDRAKIENIVREYILAHPEIISEAARKLQDRETAKLIDSRRKEIETPFAGAWAGARDADVVLVEFFDYACGYCRASAPHVERLLEEDKNLKVVWRELPILGPDSEAAARVSLSAAKQGGFRAFHHQMFQGGTPSAANIAVAQRQARLDWAKVQADAASPEVAREIDANIELARMLQISGTPTFVIGDRMISGAAGYAALKEAVAAARETRTR